MTLYKSDKVAGTDLMPESKDTVFMLWVLKYLQMSRSHVEIVTQFCKGYSLNGYSLFPAGILHSVLHTYLCRKVKMEV
jgi:hypothetical protein